VEKTENMVQVLDHVAEPYYGLPAAEIWRNASAKDKIADAKVPVLVLHPEDDVIVKVEHAHMLEEAARDNDLVRVWVLPAGAHGILEAIDSVFTYGVYRGFFDRWAVYAERPQVRDSRAASEVVYSASDSG
jgi:pimeloyl-ACP methyl ester carboxylesterase